MRTSDFNIKPSANSLNETLNSKFGEKLDINNYSIAQLSRAAALIENKLAAYSKSKFNDTLKNEEFHRLKLMHDVVKTALNERAVSKSQQQAAGAALAAKRGEGKAKGASKEMMKMSTKELKKIAGTKHKGLPDKVDEASKSSQSKPKFYSDTMKNATKFKDSDVTRMMRDEKARKAAEEKKKQKVDEGILGGIAGGGLGYLATGGNPLGALAGGYLGSQLDEVAELAWENARSYVRSIKRGMLEQSKHYREACKNWGGKIWHDDMGECWMSHSSINEGQPFKVHGLGENAAAAFDLGQAATDAMTSVGDWATANPGLAAAGAGAAGIAAGSMMGGDDTDESLDEFDLTSTLQDLGANAGRYVGDTFARVAPGAARSLAGDPSMFGIPASDASIAAGIGDRAAEFGKNAAIPVAVGGAGLAGLAAGSTMGSKKKERETDEGVIGKGFKRTVAGKIGGIAGGLGGAALGGLGATALGADPALGAIGGGVIGGLGGEIVGSGSTDEGVIGKGIKRTVAGGIGGAAGGLGGAALGSMAAKALGVDPTIGALGGGAIGGLAGKVVGSGAVDEEENESIKSGASKAWKLGKKTLGGTVGALGGGTLGKMAGAAVGNPELGQIAGAGLGALAGVNAVDEEHLAKKDYDGDGKIEKSSDEWKGSRDKAIKKAMAMRESIYKMLREGEEGKAEIIMAVKNMVDKFTGWSEDIAQMQAQTAMEMADSIRDELGNEMAEQFAAAVQPALDTAFQGVKSARETLSTTVGTLTGESPAPMGGDDMSMGGAPAPMPASMPTDSETPDEIPDMEMPPEGRAKRESIERRFRIAKILAS